MLAWIAIEAAIIQMPNPYAVEWLKKARAAYLASGRQAAWKKYYHHKDWFCLGDSLPKLPIETQQHHA